MPLEGGVAQRIALVDVVSGLLDKGTVISGQATVSVGGVDLVHVALNLLVSSVETLRQAGAPPTNPVSPTPIPAPPAPSRPPIGGATASPPLISAPREATILWEEPVTPDRGQVLMSNASPASTEAAAEERQDQGLAGLVLALVELIRQLLERQAVRRMEGGSLTEEEVERMGRALMELSAKMKELFAIFGLDEGDVNLDLGPLGPLL
jgi:Gas vesicle protein K/Gas vesicle protein